MSTATVRAGIDTSALQDFPSTNYGANKYLYSSSGTTTRYGYIWFKSPAPLGAVVTSATLRIRGYNTWGAGAVTVSLQRISSTWQSALLTWNNKPAVTGTIVTVTQANLLDKTEWAFNVTALLQTIASGAANYGFRIAVTSTTRRDFYSLESGDNAPTLDVTWSDAPKAPHTLSPSGSHAVSVAKPILRFDFVDVSGSVALAAVQVQIDAAANWAAPAFDSGTVSTTDPELDLTLTAYAGLAVAATTQWRVRVQDGAGLWSVWSDPATFTRVAKGVLTIDNPALAPNDFVADYTPPILWTLTGIVQTAWRVVVTTSDAPTHFLHDTGWRTGTATAYTLPAGILTVDAGVYRVVVQIRDTASRESTPGDPIFTELVRVFTMRTDATVAAVTALAVTDVLDRPWADLTWTRTTAPDSFSVARDGLWVASGLLPGDLNTGGTGYYWTDRDAAANIPHSWQVRAVVNGKQSTSASVVATIDAAGVWLTDVVSNRLCPFLNADSSFAMPEAATVYEPVGAKAVVRITQGQRGLEGSISGLVTDYAGATALGWLNHLLYFKLHPHLPLRLTLGTESLRVIVGNMVISPIQFGGADDRAVSFDFWSLDGPM